MREIASGGELATLSAERVWQETEKALQTERPAVFFEVLRRANALAVIFPEIDRLFGVPQSPKWHPEIDTGVHTLLALSQAATLSADAVVRFAVLVHDLGKGTTPTEMLPRHHGHEQRSVRLIAALGERLRVPKRYLALASAVAEFHGIAHRAAELRPETMLKLLTAIGAMRNPAVLDDFIIACLADLRGRTGLETSPYPQGDRLRLALAAATAIKADDLPDKTLEGKAIGAALASRRVAAIGEATKSQPPP
jgi:tRNA nucleotidyltransferase (CCA-adding enzyme)